MSLAHLTIRYEKARKNNFTGELKARFNPAQLAYTRTVNWSPFHTAAPTRPGFNLRYQSTAPETLTLDLFFDTYADAGAQGPLLGLLPSVAPRAASVKDETDAVADLARIDTELHRPPVCKLQWGQVPIFQGILQQSTRTLQMFLEDGTPVRATMSCTFLESPDEVLTAKAEMHSPDVAKQYVVRPGDTLMAIAAALYGDVSLWRHIANANRIENPRRLFPGQTLAIPRLR